jgi:hypothetical protein
MMSSVSFASMPVIVPAFNILAPARGYRKFYADQYWLKISLDTFVSFRLERVKATIL